MIKIDVEGAEVKVLEGAYNTLKYSKSIIVFEVAPANLRAFGNSEEELFEKVLSLGFKFFYVLNGREAKIQTVETILSQCSQLNPDQFINCVASKEPI